MVSHGGLMWPTLESCAFLNDRWPDPNLVCLCDSEVAPVITLRHIFVFGNRPLEGAGANEGHASKILDPFQYFRKILWTVSQSICLYETTMLNKASPSSGLEAQALAQFDALVEKGEIYWEPTEEIKIEQEPFHVCF